VARERCIARNNGAFTNNNPNAPEGKQVGIVQMTGSTSNRARWRLEPTISICAQPSAAAGTQASSRLKQACNQPFRLSPAQSNSFGTEARSSRNATRTMLLRVAFTRKANRLAAQAIITRAIIWDRYRAYDASVGRWDNDPVNSIDVFGLAGVQPNAAQQAQINNALMAMHSLTGVHSDQAILSKSRK
jgi:hypothetical protein